jgi:glycine/D-amino acid oxidase-like deaminating enzyme
MTKYGKSPWIDRFPRSRVRAYPRQRGPLAVDVAVVGGGLTGCAVAYAFSAAGIKVALVEAGKIGRGVSGSAFGWIASDPGASFAEVEKALGRRAARHAWEAWRRAALDFSATIRRLDIRCHLEPTGTLLVASAPAQLADLRKEQKARQVAGLDAPMVNARTVARETGLDAAAAIRIHGDAAVDPYRAAVGLADAASRRGAQIFEGSLAKRTRFGRRWAEVQTEGGAIRVSRIVIATGAETDLFASLARHVWFKTTFLTLTERVPAAVRRQLGNRTTVVRDRTLPPHAVRWVDGERLLVTGADGDVQPPRVREKTLVQRTGQLMYELSVMYPDISGILPAYGWEAPYLRTADGLPYIGPHRNYPHHLFAVGDGSHSVTGAYLASRILLRHHLGEQEAADEVFGFLR